MEADRGFFVVTFPCSNILSFFEDPDCNMPFVSMTCENYQSEVMDLIAMHYNKSENYDATLSFAQKSVTWNQTRVELFKEGIIQKRLPRPKPLY